MSLLTFHIRPSLKLRTFVLMKSNASSDSAHVNDPSSDCLINRQYLVIAPTEVRPGGVYRVILSLLSSQSDVKFSATIQRNGEEIASNNEVLSNGDTKALLTRVRDTF